MNFVKFLRTPFFIEHLWWLLPCGFHEAFQNNLSAEHLRKAFSEFFLEAFSLDSYNDFVSRTLFHSVCSEEMLLGVRKFIVGNSIESFFT